MLVAACGMVQVTMALWTFLRKLARSAGNLRMIVFSVGIGLVTALFAPGCFYALEWVTHTCFVAGAGFPLILVALPVFALVMVVVVVGARPRALTSMAEEGVSAAGGRRNSPPRAGAVSNS